VCEKSDEVCVAARFVFSSRIPFALRAVRAYCFDGQKGSLFDRIFGISNPQRASQPRAATFLVLFSEIGTALANNKDRSTLRSEPLLSQSWLGGPSHITKARA
jgi:hypothetical protein